MMWLMRLMRSMKDGRRLRLALAPARKQNSEVATADFTVTVEVPRTRFTGNA